MQQVFHQADFFITGSSSILLTEHKVLLSVFLNSGCNTLIYELLNVQFWSEKPVVAATSQHGSTLLSLCTITFHFSIKCVCVSQIIIWVKELHFFFFFIPFIKIYSTKIVLRNHCRRKKWTRKITPVICVFQLSALGPILYCLCTHRRDLTAITRRTLEAS